MIQNVLIYQINDMQKTELKSFFASRKRAIEGTYEPVSVMHTQ